MGTETREKLVARLKAKVEKRRQEAAVNSVVKSGAGWKRQAFVRVSNFEFVPNCAVVLRGASVTWTCCSQDSLLGPEVETHRIKFKDPSFPCSKDLRSGESFTLTFEKPGVYPYYCANYNFVMGWVKVLEDQPQQKNTSTDVSPADLERIAREIGISTTNTTTSTSTSTSTGSSSSSAAASAKQNNAKRKTKTSKRSKKKILHRVSTDSSASSGPENDDLCAATFTTKMSSDANADANAHADADNTICGTTERQSTDFDDFSEKKSESSSHSTALAALEDFHDLEDSSHRQGHPDDEDHEENHEEHVLEGKGDEDAVSATLDFDDSFDFAGLAEAGAQAPRELVDEQRRLEEAFAAAAAVEREAQWIDAPRRKRRSRRQQQQQQQQQQQDVGVSPEVAPPSPPPSQVSPVASSAEITAKQKQKPKTHEVNEMTEPLSSAFDRKAICDLLLQKWNEAA
ncbi:Hypothetical Protein FCC1311_047662 [Hondaea fermentalgiana]|uniref:Uncharacterized protein n=1 Tax=Hondaea fermentalgiana TaxID=2315210 RepID=A0A2R5GIR2_9STRA|nr:Hypothetical Protein FCC1311_047662 [Hondaea fermentalgiana]|eukprot:GBG28543.1 Hypothetical Protein FCC1311_047662 [Hondaea fermentalgiana]